jgi:hypothetical protein
VDLLALLKGGIEIDEPLAHGEAARKCLADRPPLDHHLAPVHDVVERELGLAGS